MLAAMMLNPQAVVRIAGMPLNPCSAPQSAPVARQGARDPTSRNAGKTRLAARRRASSPSVITTKLKNRCNADSFWIGGGGQRRPRRHSSRKRRTQATLPIIMWPSAVGQRRIALAWLSSSR